MTTGFPFLMLLRAILVMAGLLVMSGAGFAQDRWALVLGIATYDSGRIASLKNTLNDSRTIAAALNDKGFKVYYLENAARGEIDSAIELIEMEQRDAEIGLLYFAGHAIQLDGENFILPSDLDPARSTPLREQAISINALVTRINAMGTKSLVVILDACRNSPLPGESAAGTGLALVDAPENTIIAYSTAPGEVAFDGTGANSPYTAALASALDGAEADIRDVLRLVRARVRLATGGAQMPWYIDNTRTAIPISPRSGTATEALVDLVKGREIDLSTTAWLTVAESADPRDFKLFLDLFPQDQLAAAAERQLVLIEAEPAPDFPLMEIEVDGPGREVPDGLMAEVTACDLLATGVGDVMAVSDPVPHDLVNTRAAMRACVEAVKNDPENPRLVGILSRVLRLSNRFDEALHYAELAAELGNPTAYLGVASFYRQGIGVTPDYARAFQAARKGALLGSPQAQLVTGVYFREGWGVEQSYPEAQRWMQLAMQNGHSHAFVAYGDFYRKGFGVPVDEAKALDYYRQAAVLGSSDAKNLIGIAYLRGKGVKQDRETGIQWLVQSSDEGNPFAAFQLGRAFQEGLGVKKDLKTALAYYRLSAQRNYLGAYIRIGDMLRQGAGGKPDLAEAYANYIIAREAAILRDTIDSAEELAEAQARIAEVTADMTPDQTAAGEKTAADWIAQYGLLDFNLVSE
ncbi:caspase family protein [Tabrizicola sp.]|uniref:caspase family protein n=1 Tax=Tabrizicola sp. TaxID=2005166 RepID=UPI0027341682|nr:caspase family protein [Tabrizicola sp.]MDP3195600.1 caspase family protein [Tabrizicola sp.]